MLENRLKLLLKAIIISAGAYGFMYLVHYLINNVMYVVLFLQRDYETALALYNKYTSERYIVSSLIVILGYFIFFRAASQPFPKLYRLKKLDFELAVISFFIGVAANVVTLTAARLLPLPQSWYDANNESVGNFTSSYLIFRLLAIMVIGPIVEEFLFRGIIYNEIKRATGTILAAIIVSALFGIYHQNILQGLYCGIVSLALVFVYEKADSLIAPIMLHIGFNASHLLTNNFYRRFSNLTMLISASIAVAGMLILYAARAKKLVPCIKNRKENNYE